MKHFRLLSHSLALIFSLSLLLFCACSPQEEPAPAEDKADVVNDDFQAMVKTYQAASDQDQKFEALTDFLTKHPDSDRTSSVIGAAIRAKFMADQENPDVEKAVEFVKAHLAKVKNPDNLAATKTVLLGIYAEAGKTEELKDLLSDLGDPEAVPLSAALEVYPIAQQAKMWDVVADYAKASVTKLDAELAKADPADLQTTRGLIRDRGEAMEALASALSEKGEVDQALEIFAEAEKSISFNFAGIVYGDFRSSYASALLKKQDYNKAMEVLTPDVVFLNKESAFDLYKEAYLAAGNKESELSAHLENQRKALGKTVPEFTVYDYEGKAVNYSDIKGKVTLLAFWFPT